MILLGLTGSIGMGKSATAAIFARLGVPAHDADAVVHALYRGAAVPLVEAAFPGITRDGAVDRPALAERVVGDEAAMARLEAVIHPLVRSAEAAFLGRARGAGRRVAVLDVPLLLETGGDSRVDAVVVATTPRDVQRARVLARPGMTAERFEQIVARQMPDGEKRRRAHFLVDTGRGFASAEEQVRGILRALAGKPGTTRR